MNHMARVFVFFHFTALFFFSSVSPQDFPELKGEYLGQPPPGLTPEVFAPGIISRRTVCSRLLLCWNKNERSNDSQYQYFVRWKIG